MVIAPPYVPRVVGSDKVELTRYVTLTHLNAHPPQKGYPTHLVVLPLVPLIVYTTHDNPYMSR